MQVNPKAGLTFASALRSILRADPDIVLIGEIRDKETATIAIEAALTGHLVLSTLHTNDAASAITRLVEMGVEPFLVAPRSTAWSPSGWRASSASAARRPTPRRGRAAARPAIPMALAGDPGALQPTGAPPARTPATGAGSACTR